MSDPWRKRVEIGDAVLYLGDCLTVLPTLGNVDAVVTDPPYGVGKAEWDNEIFDLLRNAANMCSSLLSDTGICFWFSSTRYLPETIEATKAIPYRWTFIWYPSNNMAHGDIGFQKFTPCIVKAHGKAWRNMQDLREIPIRTNEGNGHPTVKPIELMLYLVEKADAKIILDPFMGSGTTGVACANLGRRFIGIEIEEKYFDIACKRIEQEYAQLKLFPPEKKHEAKQLDLIPKGNIL